MASKLPDDVRDALLDKLSSDDSFREIFQSDPRQALESIGLTTDVDEHAAAANSCLQQSGLPSKQAISETRKRVAQQTGDATSDYHAFKA